MPSRLEDEILRTRAEIIARDLRTRQQLLELYIDLERRLRGMIELLQATINESGFGMTSELWQLQRWQILEQQLLTELGRVARMGATITEAGMVEMVAMAQEHALALTQAASNAVTTINWQRLPADALVDFLAVSRVGAPVDLLFAQLAGPELVALAKAEIAEGLTVGRNPRVVAKAIENLLNISATRAQTISRTEMLRAQRSATLATYEANSDIISEWEWCSAKDEATCLACLAMDGARFPLSEQFFPAHPNCRCAAIPVVSGFDQSRTTAGEWFSGISQEKQLEMIPAGLREDYLAGRVVLNDFVTTAYSPIWGESVQQATVGSIRAAM